jgi:ABC-type phosphate transport system auxiliary subunit
MAYAITMDILQLLEDKLGKEEGRKVARAIEIGLEVIDKKAESVALQKKFEIKDELTKELVTKAEFIGEMKTLRQEMETLRQEMETLRHEVKYDILRLDRKFTVMFVILFFIIIFLNQNALEFMAKVLGLIK